MDLILLFNSNILMHSSTHKKFYGSFQSFTVVFKVLLSAVSYTCDENKCYYQNTRETFGLTVK